MRRKVLYALIIGFFGLISGLTYFWISGTSQGGITCSACASIYRDHDAAVQAVDDAYPQKNLTVGRLNPSCYSTCDTSETVPGEYPVRMNGTNVGVVKVSKEQTKLNIELDG